MVLLLTQHVVNTCQRRLSNTVLATEKLPERQSTSVKKVSEEMRSSALKEG